MVNLVIVSHSAALGKGVCELAQQMLQDSPHCRIAVAAGLDDPDWPIGTDPVKVMSAIESVADASDIVVLMDIGSALLSAETALELLDPAIAAKVTLCPAPLVEGALAATVAAASGAGLAKVMAEAENALAAKRVQLGCEEPVPEALQPASVPAGDDAHIAAWTVDNPHGLHVRPASRLIAALSGFNADLLLEKNGKCIKPDSLNQIALLQVHCGDTIRLIARGPEADAALTAFTDLAKTRFGEPDAPVPRTTRSPEQVTGIVHWLTRPCPPADIAGTEDATQARQRLKHAIDHTLDDLLTLARQAEQAGMHDVAEIFSGHHTLLDDPELYMAACEKITDASLSAAQAWQAIMMDIAGQYRQLDDAYLQARYIDIEDILARSLAHLSGTSPVPLVFEQPTLLCGRDIYPSLVMQLDPGQVPGICLQEGSPQSHSAIIAARCGIVFLSGLGKKLDGVIDGEWLTMDARAGTVSHA